jgi:hypothetical protein
MRKQITNLAKDYMTSPLLVLKNVTWRIKPKISNGKYIFIVGSPRSGTTLLQRILSTHPDAFSTTGETALFTFQNIFNPKRRHFDLEYPQIRTLQKQSIDIIDFFDNCVATLNKKIGYHKKIFIEKTPHHVMRSDFLKKHFPNSKIINIVRDGRDCYCSAKKHPGVPYGSSAKSFARYWAKCIDRWMVANEGANCFTIKYEDLANNPHAEIGKLMDFIGLEIHPNQLNPKFLGEDPRSKRPVFSKLNEPINNLSINRWKEEMNSDQITIFHKYAGKQLDQLGY